MYLTPNHECYETFGKLEPNIDYTLSSLYRVKNGGTARRYGTVVIWVRTFAIPYPFRNSAVAVPVLRIVEITDVAEGVFKRSQG